MAGRGAVASPSAGIAGPRRYADAMLEGAAAVATITIVLIATFALATPDIGHLRLILSGNLTGYLELW